MSRYALLLPALGLALLTGCSSTPIAPIRSGYLSNYSKLEKVDGNTSRYIYPSRLAQYNKFALREVKVTIEEYNGKPVTPEQRERASARLREIVTKALADKYPVVNEASADTAEIHVAITQAYKTGLRVGLTVEGEILDSYSGAQLAAVMKTELGETYIGDWWDRPSARDLMEKWARNLRQAIDKAHGK